MSNTFDRKALDMTTFPILIYFVFYWISGILRFCSFADSVSDDKLLVVLVLIHMSVTVEFSPFPPPASHTATVVAKLITAIIVRDISRLEGVITVNVLRIEVAIY